MRVSRVHESAASPASLPANARDWVAPAPVHSLALHADSSAAADARGPVFIGASILICLAFAVQSLVWGTNADTSWLITVVDRLHAGDRLFVDIIELNPPSSVWLYFAPVRLSYVTGISAEALVRVYTLLISAGAIASMGWIVRAGSLMPQRAVTPALALLFVAAAVLVGNSFAERDHIGAVLLTPLIALAAWRSTDLAVRPRVQHWLAAGAAGGVMALVKPHYAIVVLAAAAYVVIRRRDVRLFLLPEFLIAGAMSITYMAAFYLAFPVYFEELLPLLGETYMAFSWPLAKLALVASPWLAVVFVYRVFAKRGGRNVLADLFVICACAAWVPYFLQGKGWAYHAYPAIYLGSAAIIITAATLLFGPSTSARQPSGRMEILALALASVLVVHLRFFDNSAPSQEFAASVRAQIPSPTVGLLGGDIAAGHPLARMIRGRWIEPYCSDWIPIFALRLADKMRMSGDTQGAGYLEQMADRYLAAKRERLMKSPPDVLIVDEHDGLVDMMIAERGFAELLAKYAKIGSDRYLTVYRLAEPSAAPPDTR